MTKTGDRPPNRDRAACLGAPRSKPSAPAIDPESLELDLLGDVEDLAGSLGPVGLEMDEDELETTRDPGPRLLKRAGKMRALRMLKREYLREVLPERPEKGVSYHIISNGRYDFWTWVPFIIREWLPAGADELTLSTWTMNRWNVQDLLELLDEGILRRADVLTGLYFKRRETAVYTTLLEGLRDRGQRFIAFRNHAKIVLIGDRASDAYITIEGSANCTANPRLEQYVLTDSWDLYDFHRTWMDEILRGDIDRTEMGRIAPSLSDGEEDIVR